MTLSALKWLVTCVNSLVNIALWCISKSHITIGAFQRLLCIGLLFVPFSCCSSMKFLTAMRACITSCTFVAFLMAFTVGFIWWWETFAALRAFYGFQVGVGAFLHSKFLRWCAAHFAQGGLGWPFNCMYPHMVCKFGRFSIAPVALWTAVHFLKPWLTHFHSAQVNMITKKDQVTTTLKKDMWLLTSLSLQNNRLVNSQAGNAHLKKQNSLQHTKSTSTKIVRNWGTSSTHFACKKPHYVMSHSGCHVSH